MTACVISHLIDAFKKKLICAFSVLDSTSGARIVCRFHEL